jgi:integrase
MMLAKASGIPVVEEEPDAKKHHFEIATKVYVSHLHSKQREDKTIRAIEQNLQFLQEATGRVYVEDIQQSDVTQDFIQALRDKGYARQTVFDRYARVVSFLKFCSKRFGTKRVVELNDGPARPRPKNDVDFSKKDPYTEQELNTLFSKSSREEKLLWKFFLDTGAREKEVIYATWKDLDLEHRLFHIRSHEKMGFRTKDRCSRTVPFTQELADALREQRAHSKGLLVFGKDGKPARHMIRILKKRALDASLNRGLCVNSKGLSCEEHPVCENWFLHRFRHTFANYHLRHGRDVATVSQ